MTVADRPAVDRATLARLLIHERATHVERTPKSRAAFEAAGHLFGGVPMTWMNKWSGGYPLYLSTARGNRVTDIDGLEYVDFALGDTGAMAGQGALDHHAAARGKLGSVAEKAVFTDATLCRQGGGFILGQQVKAGGEAAGGKVDAQAGVLYSGGSCCASTVCSHKGLGAV